MKVALIALVGALLIGCQKREPKLSDEQIAEFRKVDPGMTDECLDKLKWGGVDALPGDYQCERLTPQRRWRGLYRSEFEAPRFCEAPADECTRETPGVYVRLEMKSY